MSDSPPPPLPEKWSRQNTLDYSVENSSSECRFTAITNLQMVLQVQAYMMKINL